MRILFLVGGWKVYGAEVAMLNVMRCLKKRDYKIHCIVSGWNDGDFISRLQKEDIPYSILRLGFFYVRRPLWTLDTLIRYPGALIDFFRIKKTFKPDLVYHLSFRTILMLYPFISKRNTVHHVHDTLPKTAQNVFFYFIARSKVAKFLAASEAVRKDLVSLGVPGDRIDVVQNGVSDPVRQNTRTRDNGVFTIGLVGQIVPRKGHLVLVEALNFVLGQGRENLIRCVIAGEGDDRYLEEIKRRIGQYRLDKQVEWRGYIQDQDSLYEDLDVLIVPSHEEAFGLVAAEAALRGIPVVASRIGGLSEIVRDGVTGFLFQTGHHRELAEKIILLMEDERLRKKMGETAREYARKNFTEEAMCGKIEMALRTVVRAR